MNSRGSVNESNLVNFSTDLPTLNQLDAKDGLLSFPFDHLYACHSDSGEHRETITLDKEIEISTCIVRDEKELVIPTSDVGQLSDLLTVTEQQNKKLRELQVFHLDLIQQQNELISRTEKSLQTLKQENEALKSRLSRMDRRLAVNQRHSSSNPPPLHVNTPVTSTVVKTEPGTAPPQITLNTFADFLLPDLNQKSFVFESDLKDKPFEIEPFLTSTASTSTVSSTVTKPTFSLSAALSASSASETTGKFNKEGFSMIENKRALVKKEVKPEPRQDALYTVTSNSGNPVIQRIQRNRRRTTSSLGSLSRMSKTPAPKPEVKPETSKYEDESRRFGRSFGLTKSKTKMINTYGIKSRGATAKKINQYTGSLSDRLRLIDTTPTGEDPYQLGEADMREQSPIPKLMLQKTNHGRMKICTDTSESLRSRRNVSTPENVKTKRLDRFNLSSTYLQPTEIKKEPKSKTAMITEPDLDLVKTEPQIDWGLYPAKSGSLTSLCDFSYGESTSNLASSILPSLDSMNFDELFSPDTPLDLTDLDPITACSSTTTTAPPRSTYTAPAKKSGGKSKRRNARTTSLVGPSLPGGDPVEAKNLGDKKGRKRALSTTGLTKNIKTENVTLKEPLLPPPKPKTPRSRAPARKKSPVPGKMTKKPYHTLVGDPDLSWYLGLDPDVKLEDVDQNPSECKAATVEVPRWREKPFSSSSCKDGIENLDDKVFEKRHQKLEAEERRQLRWHMRRIREQRHVERLRQRQRDSWCSSTSVHQQPAVFTVWPHTQRDVHFIEITDTLPVMAFGEILPDLPNTDFVLPWVRTSKKKALKRSKRSKTLN